MSMNKTLWWKRKSYYYFKSIGDAVITTDENANVTFLNLVALKRFCIVQKKKLLEKNKMIF